MQRYSDTGYAYLLRGNLTTYDYSDLPVRGNIYANYPSLTYGRRTYFVDNDMDMIPPANVMVGHYTSVGQDVCFAVNINHNFRSVSTFPLFILSSGFANPYIDDEFVEPQKRQIVIGSDVWIGREAMIMGGVNIGNGAVIGARSVVTRDVPSYAIAVGSPARVVGYRFQPEICRRLNEIKWWLWPEDKIVANAELMRRPSDFVAAHYTPPAETGRLSRDIRQLFPGRKVFLIYVDGEERYPEWERVLQEWLSAKLPQVALLLCLLNEGNDVADAVNKFMASLGEEEKAGIRVLTMRGRFPVDIVNGMDYFITTKSAKCLPFVDYAFSAGISIIHGVDAHPFRTFAGE